MNYVSPQASLSASLEPLETSEVDDQGQSLSQAVLHSRWRAARVHLLGVLTRSGEQRHLKRAVRIAGCCQFPEVRTTPDGSPRLSLRPCRDRMCPRCQAWRSKHKAEALAAAAEKFDAPKFITFTLRHRAAPLADQWSAILAAFKKLRAFPAWKRMVRGGLAVVQVTLNKSTGRWHPHLHLLCDSGYIDQRELSRWWKEASGGSTIVDIRAVDSRKKFATYLSRYMGRGGDSDGWSSGKLLEYVDAAHGRRMIQAFGSCHGAMAEREDELEKTETTRVEFTTTNLAYWCRRGSGSARAARDVLARLGWSWAAALGVRLVHGASLGPPPGSAEVAEAIATARLLYLRSVHQGTPEEDAAAAEAYRVGIESERAKAAMIREFNRPRMFDGQVANPSSASGSSSPPLIDQASGPTNA